MTGTVINIQKFTVHDGPGIRTEVFMKGCPLKCLWCSNPESIKPNPEVGVYGKSCIGLDKCGWCVKACSNGALQVVDNKVASIDRQKCVGCLKCAKSCPNDSLKTFGEVMTVPEVMSKIRDDRFFYDRSRGGVTLSGGDPLIQWQFSLEILKECKRVGIHTCLETELHCSQEVLDQVLPYVDMLISDLKHIDSASHKNFTGVGNERILENLRYLASKNIAIVMRYPVVPGYNDSEANVEATANFILREMNNNIRQFQLLPYRPLGTDKYEALGIPYPMGEVKPPNRAEYEANLKRLAELFRQRGIPAAAGTTTIIP